jgi:hypothetical protein
MTTKLDPATLRWCVRKLRHYQRIDAKAASNKIYDQDTRNRRAAMAASEGFLAQMFLAEARAAERRRER